MQENSRTKPKIDFKKKTTLIISGLFLFLILLEIGLRLGGFILLSIQEHRNFQSIKQKGTYRIVCLGESTTAGQYPPFLEEILNQRKIGVRFSVIDKGMTGANTPAILSKVEAYLDEYHPDMVVTMMGCNDEGVRYYQDIPESDTWLFRHCRVYRFSRLIYMHILKKIKQEGIYGLNRSASGRKAKLEDTGTVVEKINLSNEGPRGKAQTYLPEIKLKDEPILTEESFEKAIELNPKNDSAYTRLGRLYRDQGKFSQAEESLKKAIDLNPKNVNAYVELAWFYLKQGKFLQAEDPFNKAIDLNPKNDSAYVGLGWFYQNQGKLSQAEESFKKAIELNPKNDNAYSGLGGFYRDQGKFLQAEDAFKKAIDLNPENDSAYTGLTWLYRDQGKSLQAEDVLKKAIDSNPKNDRAYGAILVLYEEIGKPNLAKEYAQKANRLRLEYYVSVTVNNYCKLKEILDKRRIKLVCVQYPMLNLEPLKQIFQGQDQGMIFVDNERVFKNAVKKSGYQEYFKDMFGGDFGHCTDKGNKLLAQNIAETILKEIFGK